MTKGYLKRKYFSRHIDGMPSCRYYTGVMRSPASNQNNGYVKAPATWDTSAGDTTPGAFIFAPQADSRDGVIKKRLGVIA
jgi:hypothetical protein